MYTEIKYYKVTKVTCFPTILVTRTPVRCWKVKKHILVSSSLSYHLYFHSLIVPPTLDFPDASIPASYRNSQTS